MIKIKLTKKQLEILKPLFEQIIEINKHGGICAIAAQIYYDGMVVKLMEDKKAQALAKALGSKMYYSCSATERINHANY